MSMRSSLRIALVAFVLALAAPSWANDVSLSAESLSVAEDGTTTYAGDVTLVVKLSTPISLRFDTSKQSGTAEILEGNVEIIVGDLRVTTKKATTTRVGGQLIVKMDTAQSREATGR